MARFSAELAAEYRTCLRHAVGYSSFVAVLALPPYALPMLYMSMRAARGGKRWVGAVFPRLIFCRGRFEHPAFTEPHREFRRLQLLRGWGHDQVYEVLPRGAGAGRADGA